MLTKLLSLLFQGNKNTWMVNEVSNQLKRGLSPCDVKISLPLEIIKLLHAKWIAELPTYMKKGQEKNH